jgi:hypothetical protein
LTQFWHSSAAGPLKKPAAQLKHLSDSSWAYLPSPQAAQLVCPDEAENFPPMQLVQALGVPGESEYFPGVQGEHVAAAAVLYLPGLHMVQPLKPEEDAAFPAAHSSQLTRELGRVEMEYFPVWQSTHMVDASEDEYFPLSQDVHVLAPADDFDPAQQGEQAVDPSVGASVPLPDA